MNFSGPFGRSTNLNVGGRSQSQDPADLRSRGAGDNVGAWTKQASEQLVHLRGAMTNELAAQDQDHIIFFIYIYIWCVYIYKILYIVCLDSNKFLCTCQVGKTNYKQ